MSTILETEFEEPTFKPYGFYPERGDCADANASEVSKASYKFNATFRTASRLRVRHAP